MIGGPIVTTPEVAKEIDLAIARGRSDKILPTNDVVAKDDGDHWSVFQYPTHLPGGTVQLGGGTLEMTINKCDGTIAAHYSR